MKQYTKDWLEELCALTETYRGKNKKLKSERRDYTPST